MVSACGIDFRSAESISNATILMGYQYHLHLLNCCFKRKKHSVKNGEVYLVYLKRILGEL